LKLTKKKNVLKICKIPDPDDIINIIKLCSKNKLNDAVNKMNDIISNGYCYPDIISSFIYVISHENIDGVNEELKLKLINVMNKTKISISRGVRSCLQLIAMICRLMIVFNENK
jgi:replication factor C subunit 2/4